MSKLLCPCGFIHNLSAIPDDGWVTISDKKYEEVIEAEICLNQISGSSDQYPFDDNPQIDEYNKNMKFIINNSGSLYECPDCKRIMWEKADTSKILIYKLED